MIDARLEAVSDLLVVTALERANSRALTRSQRGANVHARHRAHERWPIDTDRVEWALSNAWIHAGLIAGRHGIDVDVQLWTSLLDSYASSLLVMGMSHSPQRLRPYLERLEVDSAALLAEHQREDADA